MKKILISVLSISILGFGLFIFHNLTLFQKCKLMSWDSYTEESWENMHFHLPVCWSSELNDEGDLLISAEGAGVFLVPAPTLWVSLLKSIPEEIPDQTISIDGKEFLEYRYGMIGSDYVPTYLNDPILIFMGTPYDELVDEYPDVALIFTSFEEIAPIAAITNEEETVDAPEEAPSVSDSFEQQSNYAYSDSTLEPDLEDGLNYDASNVFDKDNATAWCRAPIDPEVDGPLAGMLTLSFGGPVGGKMIGIMPGFARDETIFWKNNRIKTLALLNGPSPLLSDATLFEFQDQYQMQYFQLPENVGSTVNLAIVDIFPGSVYEDSCISEVVLK